MVKSPFVGVIEKENGYYNSSDRVYRTNHCTHFTRGTQSVKGTLRIEILDYIQRSKKRKVY